MANKNRYSLSVQVNILKLWLILVFARTCGIVFPYRNLDFILRNLN